jgi:hypothetical protein
MPHIPFKQVVRRRKPDRKKEDLSNVIVYYQHSSGFRFGRAERALRNFWIWLTCAVFKRWCK